ncbi:hypothetical protein Pcinc_007556 [Petrolisthes cinctipes]|uniref:Uncharacterized protein n=1 Tax=Petrolisthes cinctipes TaxID=88211 RepID=A0AAE1KXB9_PETCI|nr:hypothetical protein Pcinc_007556 [Petrolisthes cinctipes]
MIIHQTSLGDRPDSRGILYSMSLASPVVMVTTHIFHWVQPASKPHNVTGSKLSVHSKTGKSRQVAGQHLMAWLQQGRYSSLPPLSASMGRGR